jgi:hypothetical protein
VYKNLTFVIFRYEHLLDMAQKKEEGGDIADDPRKLKPGELAALHQGSSM